MRLDLKIVADEHSDNSTLAKYSKDGFPRQFDDERL
jgi:hypothetical protein